MSTLRTTNLKHESSSSNNIVLDSSGNATVAGNLTVTGTAQNKVVGEHSASGGQSIGTGNSYEYTPGIPDTAKIIYFSYYNLAATGTDGLRLQLGDASSFATSGYNNMTAYASNGSVVAVQENTSYIAIPHTGWSSADNDFYGYLQFINHVDNHWMYMHQCVEPDNPYVNWGNGFVNLDLKKFKIYWSGSDTFESGGTVNCHWIS